MILTELPPAIDSAGFAFLRVLLAMIWQSSLFLAAVALIALLLRRKRTAVRHRLWVMALLALPLLPLLGGVYTLLSAPRVELRVFPAYTVPAASVPSINTVTPRGPVIPEAAPVPTPESEFPKPSIADYPWALFLAGYTLTALLSLSLLGLGWMRLRGWRRTGRVVTDPRTLALFGKAEAALGLSWRFQLAECTGLPAPLTLGFFRPIILLPTGLASSLPDDGLRAVAAHELAHMRRGDPLTLAVVSLLRAVFFFHPLVWYAVRQVADLAEEACDDRVLETGCEPVEYAELLARMAASLRKPSFTAELAAGFVFSRHAFLHRVEAILSVKKAHIGRLSRLALAGVVAATVLSLGIALALPLGEHGRSSPATWEAFLKDIANEAAFMEHLKATGEVPESIMGHGSITGVYRALRKDRAPLFILECAPYNQYPRPYWGSLVVFGSDGAILRTMDREVIEKGVVEPDSAVIMEKTWRGATIDLPDLDGDGDADIPVCRQMEKQQPEGTFILYSTRSENLPVIFALDIFRRWPYVQLAVERDMSSSELLLVARKAGARPVDGVVMPVGTNLGGNTTTIEGETDTNSPLREIAAFRRSAEREGFTGTKYGPLGLWEVLDPSKVTGPEEMRNRKSKKIMRPPTMELVIRRSRAILPEGVGGDDSLALIEFKRLYSLKAGEDLKYIGPPLPPSRNVYYRLANPVEAKVDTEAPPSILFKYGDQLRLVTFCKPNIEILPQLLLNLKPFEITGNRKILEKQIEGDFIIREGLSPERAAALLGQILTSDLNIPVTLAFREEQREVIVVKGSWRFTPFPDGPPMVEAFPGKPESLREGWVREDNLEAFISWIGDASGRTVVDEVTSPHSIPVTWHWDTSKRDYFERPEAVFRQVSRQTGLTFTMEKRPVRVLEVERNK